MTGYKAVPLWVVECAAGHTTRAAVADDAADLGRCLHRLDSGLCRSRLAPVVCVICDQPFTEVEWDDRHELQDGWCHPVCCDESECQ